ncbi:MAG: galactose-1-phosphate uridylyltransferase [Sporichthyaceae bacterium]|nr:galactose-1-phosphate uridylyltransferase [Sporichthyaceae bacterium]
MRRTSARLADGREIVYFDLDDFRPDRHVRDPRDLGPVSTASEIRYDAVLDEWVTMASHRQSRTHLPPADECPLCPSKPGRQTEVPAPDYDVAVFENRFPSFATSLDQPVDSQPVSVADEIFARGPGLGRCEVVCYTSDHNAALSQLSPEHVALVVEAWVDRTRELSAVPHVEQVFCFENRGEEIGVTLAHPHGQIYAYPFVTPRTRRMLDSARRHRERTWRNLFADVLAAELADGSRVVTASEHWVAFVPSAARWPIEVHLYPRRQVPDLPALTDGERRDFARIYLQVLRAMDALYDQPLPYISAWHQAPVRIDRDLAYLHLQVFSVRRAANKLKYLAGSESGMGVFINDVTPEQAAGALRAVAPDSEVRR